MRIDADRGYSSLPEVAFDQGRKRTLRDAATLGRRCAKQVVSYVAGNRLAYHCFLGKFLITGNPAVNVQAGKEAGT